MPTEIAVSLDPRSAFAKKVAGTLDAYGNWELPDAGDLFYVILIEAPGGDADAPVQFAYEIAGAQRQTGTCPGLYTVGEVARHLDRAPLLPEWMTGVIR